MACVFARVCGGRGGGKEEGKRRERKKERKSREERNIEIERQRDKGVCGP